MRIILANLCGRISIFCDKRGHFSDINVKLESCTCNRADYEAKLEPSSLEIRQETVSVSFVEFAI